VIAKLAGLAIDARFAVRGVVRGVVPGVCDPVARALAARWIAANALSASGVRVVLEGTPPREPSVFALRAGSLAAVIAAIASVPVLVDAAILPLRWRLVLLALGLPALDRSPAAALADGASVLSSDGFGLCELAVDRESHGFRVRIGSPERMLAA
jgi:hypothetical protein